MQLVLLMPRIYGILNAGANEAIWRIELEQINIAVSFTLQLITSPQSSAPATAKGGLREPVEPGEYISQKLCDSMLRLRLPPRHEM